MFWAEKVAEEIKKRGKPLEWVDDMKTPSGRIHVGALRGVLIHDEIYKELLKLGVNAKFTYIFDDFDPMDSLPNYLPKEKFEKYMGVPLNKIPSPNDDPKLNYAQFYALEFKKVFNSLEANPEILWQGELYQSGKMNQAIKIALDNSEKILDTYQEVSGSQKRQMGWLPFVPVCQNCGKIGTTKATKWDGKEVEYECLEDLVKWAKGCRFKGKVSPFNGTGKLPWKVDWPSMWFTLGITVEGAGKDHSSAGGSRDIANRLCQKVFKIKPPFDLPYEFFIVEGAKMSSSKGVGVSAKEALDSLPAEVLRFLIVTPRPNQVIDFDPSDKDFIFRLFDAYDNFSKEKNNIEQNGRYKERKFSMPRFSSLVNWVQMPNVNPEKEAEKLKGFPLTKEEKEKLSSRVSYVKIWIEKYATEEVKFAVSKERPEGVKELTAEQRELLKKIAQEVDRNTPSAGGAEKFQNKIYQFGKELGLSSEQTFKAIYIVLLGKDHGPKAGWLILSLDKEFIKERLASL